MFGNKHDPRSEEEKARADLKRNQEMGTAPKQSPLTERPSVTPETFGQDEREAIAERDADAMTRAKE